MRVALAAARHSRIVAAAWIAGTITLFAVSLAAGGIRAASAADGVASQTEASRAAAAMQPGADSAFEQFDVVVTSGSLRATDPAFQASVAAILGRLRSASAVVDGREEPAIAGLADPYASPLEAGLIAPDLTSVRLSGRIEGGPGVLEPRAHAAEAELASIRAAYPAFEIHAVSTTLLSDGMAEEINRDMDASLLVSIPATFLILLFAFGALVAACVPLLLAITALLGAFALFGFFSRLGDPVSPYGAQFIVLIGLAVAVDYSLFVITRFRSERRAGRPKMAAIEAACATSGRAVLFSGLAVMVSLAALLLLPDPMFQSMAVGTIAAIAVSILGSLVFLPAVLALLGDGIDRGRIPFVASHLPDAAAYWTRAVRGVMRRPVVAALLATAALLAVASPIARLRLGESDITAFPGRIDAVAAVAALQEHWPQGALLRLDVVVTDAGAPARHAAIAGLEPRLLALSGLSGPAQVTAAPDGSATRVSVLMSGTANDPGNWGTVRRVREGIVPALFGAEATGVFVGGGAATSLDQTSIFTDGMARILVFVLGLSFVLLLLVFRSIAIPAKAIVLNLLATGAAFGAMVLVFRDGWLAGPLGIAPSGVIQNFVPVFVFTVLFGLSMDYEVFILSRIREAIDAGLESREAVERGIAETAGTVTSAAAIMVVVFAIFLMLPLPIARELGIGMTIAVFLDATLIRTVLLPATMRLLGDWNWWLPSWLRWLPRVTIDGDVAPDASPGPSPAPALPSGTTATFR